MDKSWINVNNKLDPRYIQGVIDFIEFACKNIPEGATKITCPCKKCHNARLVKIDVVKDHLIVNGFIPSYTRWIFHGEQLESPECGIKNSGQGDSDGQDGMEEMLREAFGIVPQRLASDVDGNDETLRDVQGSNDETNNFF